MARRLRRSFGQRRSFGLHESTVSVAGRPIRSLSAGAAGSAAEVIMLPGLGAPGYLIPWAKMIAEWARVTILDLPGWRVGRRSDCEPTVDGIAATVVAWLGVTGRHDTILLGHSTGANAAVHAALLDPGRLIGVVLAGPTFEPAARTLLTLLRRAVPTFAHEVPAELVAIAPSYAAAGAPRLLRLIRSGQRDRLEDLVASLPVPCVFITGHHDGFAPPWWTRHLALLGHAACHVVPGGHNGCYPFPDEADAALREGVRPWLSSGPQRAEERL